MKNLVLSLPLLCLLGADPAAAQAVSETANDPAPAAQQEDEPSLGEILATAVLAMSEDDLEAAEVLFAAASENYPQDPRPWLGSSRVAERRGDILLAVQHARQAYRVAPGVGDVGLELGRLLTRLGTVGEALEVFAHVRQVEPTRSEAYLLPSLILRQVGDNAASALILESARQHAANAPRLDEELALRYLALDRQEDALALGQEILATHGPRPLAHLVTGLALAATGQRSEEARQHLQQAIEMDVPDAGRAHLELGILWLEDQQAATALDHLEKARTALPDSPEVYYRLAAAQRATGDGEAARRSLAKFQELNRQQDGDDWQDKELGATLNSIQALAAGNKLDEAKRQLRQLLEVHPEAHKAYALLAKIQFSTDQAADASASILRARKLAPREVEYHFLEGYFAAHQQLADQAQEALGRALALDDELPEAHALVAVLHADAERFEPSAAHFARALELGLDTVDLRRRYAAVLEALGRHEESAQQLSAVDGRPEPG